MEPVSELRSVTCHIGLHCHPTQVNAPNLTPARQPVLDLPAPKGWKAELTLVVGCIPRWFTCPQTATHPGSNHLIETRPGVELMTSYS